jgi:hypothetical protein
VPLCGVMARGLATLGHVLSLCAATRASYTECVGETHIKNGDCNSPTKPCKAGSGYVNVFAQPTLQACEAKCDEALPKGNCAGVTWHDAKAGAWARVCVLETADAWAGYEQGSFAHHVSACNGLAPCKCGGGGQPPSPPSPGRHADPAGCIVKQAALQYSQHALKPPRHADRIADALDLSGCQKLRPRSTPTPVSTAAATSASVTAAAAAASFWVDAAKGSDSAAGTSAATAFRTLERAQTAARGAAPPTVVHLLPGATHYLERTLTLTPGAPPPGLV